MRPTPRRAQLEASFQWIFVLIAGLVFLLIFFFAFRSCTHAGQERLQANSARSAAIALGGYAWEPELSKNETFPPLAVSCPGNGSLTLSTSGMSDAGPVHASLDLVPAFLPPALGGRNRIFTRGIMLDATPSIALGNVLYATNENTYYFIIDDARFRKPLGIIGADPATRLTVMGKASDINPRLQTLPAQATVIIASVESGAAGRPDASALKPLPGMTAYWVSFDGQNNSNFYEFKDGSFRFVGREKSIGDHLVAGAIISGRLETYTCAKANVVGRMRYATTVMENRAKELRRSDKVPAYCKDYALKESQKELNAINRKPDDQYLAALFTSATLVAKQRALSDRGCPVIG